MKLTGWYGRYGTGEVSLPISPAVSPGPNYAIDGTKAPAAKPASTSTAADASTNNSTAEPNTTTTDPRISTYTSPKLSYQTCTGTTPGRAPTIRREVDEPGTPVHYNHPGAEGTAPYWLDLAAGEHLLRSRDAVAEPVLKRGVTFALLDVASDRSANHLRDWLTVDGSDGVQFLGLVRGQANGHGLIRSLVRIHFLILPPRPAGGQVPLNYGILIPINQPTRGERQNVRKRLHQHER